MALVDFSLSDIGNVFTSIREAWTGKKIEDPVEFAKIDLQLEQLIQASRNGQIEINKIEAAHKSLFVAGARPFMMWICGFGMAYVYLIQPMIEWICVLSGVDVKTPEVDVDTLYQLVIAMLGMSTLRTYEKAKGVAREK